MEIRREEVRQLRFFCVSIPLLNETSEGEVYPSVAPAFAACCLTQVARKADVIRKSQVYHYKGCSVRVDMTYTPLQT